jgi:thioredoxin-related protein
MKRSILFLLVFAASFTSSFAQETQNQINWMTWEEATAQHKIDLANYNDATIPKEAKTPPKKVYIDLYTSWCGWCKKMDQSTFKDPVIVNIMNKYYYPVKMDAERSGPIDFNGHTFVNPDPGKSRSTHQFAASILDYQLSYPSYVILDENLQRIVIYKGYLQVDDLLGIILFFGKNQNQQYQKQLTKQIKLQASAPQVQENQQVAPK